MHALRARSEEDKMKPDMKEKPEVVETKVIEIFNKKVVWEGGQPFSFDRHASDRQWRARFSEGVSLTREELIKLLNAMECLPQDEVPK